MSESPVSLVQFLLARIGEEEAVAREAALLPEGVQRVEKTLPEGPWRGFDEAGQEMLPLIAASIDSPAAEPTGDWGWNGGPYDHDHPEAKQLAAIFGEEPWSGVEVLPYRVTDAGGWDEKEEDGAQYVVAEIPGRCRGVARHIASHSPLRVLAECDAKRQIVDEYARVSSPGVFDRGEVTSGLRKALRFLSLPYASHPDWREEWRP